MSIFGTISGIVRISDWFIGVYKNAKKKFKEWNTRRVTRNIRESIDKRSTSVVARRVRKIIKKRGDRRDSN